LSNSDHIPQWKIAVAAAVVAVVAAAVAIIALVRGVVPGRDAEPDLPSQSPAPATTEPDAVIASVQRALDAWEAFARTAELDGVEQAFVVDGPQYRQFERESRNGKAGVDQVPTFSLQSVDAVERAGRQRKVLARVALTGEEPEPDVREWEFVLERVAGSWRVWTVVDQTSR
jgi:hypothetical protein